MGLNRCLAVRPTSLQLPRIISPPTLTLWERHNKNSLIHATTLGSTPESTNLVSSRSWGTLSKAFEKSIITAASLEASSSDSARPWHTVIDSHMSTLTWNSVALHTSNHNYPILAEYNLLWCAPSVSKLPMLNWPAYSFEPPNGLLPCRPVPQ